MSYCTKVLLIFCHLNLLGSNALSQNSNVGSTVPSFEFTGIKQNENAGPDFDQCSSNPYLALMSKVDPMLVFQAARVEKEQEKFDHFRNDPYAEVVCVNLTSTRERMQKFGGALGVLDRIIDPIAEFVENAEADIQAKEDRIQEFVFVPNVAAISPSSSIVEYCKDPRKLEILSLPNTPECRKAAQVMDSTGLGAELLGVRADAQKIRDVKRSMREEIEKGSPDAFGWIEVAAVAGIIAAGAAVYSLWNDYRDEAASTQDSIDLIKEIDRDIKSNNARIDEINADIKLVRELKAEDSGNVLVEAAVLGYQLSQKSVDEIVDTGAQTYDEIEKDLQKEKDGLNKENSNKDIQRDKEVKEAGCDPAKGGCGTPCGHDECAEFAIDKVFERGERYIAQCLKDIPVSEEVEIPPMPNSILADQIPNCKIQFGDNPCAANDPLICGDPEYFKRQNAKRHAVGLATSLRCEIEEELIECQATQDAILSLAIGKRPSGVFHELLCGKITSPNFSLENTSERVTSLQSSTNPYSQFLLVRDCQKFMGFERCGEEKECHKLAASTISGSSARYLDLLQHHKILGFFRAYPRCASFEENIRSFWHLYSNHLNDLAVLTPGSSSKTFEFLTTNDSFVDEVLFGPKKPSDLNTVVATPLGDLEAEALSKFDEPAQPAVGSREYYRLHFCE